MQEKTFYMAVCKFVMRPVLLAERQRRSFSISELKMMPYRGDLRVPNGPSLTWSSATNSWRRRKHLMSYGGFVVTES